MKFSLILGLCAAFVPVAALAETGGKDSYLSQFTELSYAMTRDGRLQRAIAEGRANKAAFDALRQREAQQTFQEPTATGALRRPRR